VEYLAGALVVLAALAFVAYPLVRRAGAEEAVAERPPSFAERRAAVYRELLELEFDHRVGKLSDADFRQLSDACLARATQLVAEEERETEAIDARIEREVALLRGALAAGAPADRGGARPA
jgi:hypothetical protein